MENPMRKIILRTAFHLAAAGLVFALAAQATPAAGAQDDRDDNIFTEGFEGDWPPAGWAEISTSSFNWARTNWDSHTGNYSAWCWQNPASQDEWLVTPALDLSSAVNPKLEFFERGYNWESNGGDHSIMVSTTSQTDPGAFSELVHWTPSDHTPGGFEGGPPTTVNLVGYVGQPTVYLAFRYKGSGSISDSWIIDDVRVYTPSGHDVGAVAVLPDGGNLSAPQAITPQAVVENFGLGTEDFDVTLEISESGSPVYSEVVAVTGLAPGYQATLDFPAYTIQPGNYYDLAATTALAGDADPGNDGFTGSFTTYFDTHVPLGMLFTNAGCGPCVQANQALDAYMPGQGNEVALMRIHVWWPSGSDIMYLHNTAQAQYLVNEFNVTGVPDFWLDAFWGLGYSGSDMVAAFDEGKTWFSPMHFELQWLPASEQLVVNMVVTGDMRPGGDYQLFCTLTEDDIHFSGGNGENIHNQAFRRMYPDVSAGVPVDGSVGTHIYVVDCPLDPIYVYDNLRGTVYVRNMNTGDIIQAGTNFLHNIEGGTDVAETPSAFGLEGAYPNPFNPKTNIEFALDVGGFATLRIFDSSGRLVRTLREGTLAAGPHSADWDGLDDAGHAVSSGLYLVRLSSGGRMDTSKLLLAK